MAKKQRKIRKKIVRTVHRVQPLTYETPEGLRRIKRITKRKVGPWVLSQREPTKRVIRQEVRKIRKKRVLPILSKISPLNCKAKKAKARRDYFSMRASGAGAKLPGPHKNRFTVRCT